MSSSNSLTVSATETRAAFEAGRTAASLTREPVIVQPRTDGSAAWQLVPKDYALAPISPPLPRRKIAFAVSDLDSFLQAVKDYRREGQTVLSLDPVARRFSAVMDFHPVNEPNAETSPTDAMPCRERAEWQLTTPPDSKAWFDADGKAMSQVAFAEFLEDYAGAIVSPDQADVLEVARTLQAKKNVDWKQGTRLQDGSLEIVFSETIEAKAGQRGTVEVPETLKLSLTLWDGVPPCEFRARLRYRITDQGLVFVVRFLELNRITREVMTDLRRLVDVKTDLPVYLGTVSGT